MDKAKMIEIAKKYGKNEKDTGSTQVQIALLTQRITELTEHLRRNKKDHSTRRGLLTMVSLRRSLISYLSREDFALYMKLTDELGIRRSK